MDPNQWNSILSRIGPHDADDLDPLLASFDPLHGSAGRSIFPLPESVLMPQTAMKRADAVCVGLRVPVGGAPDAADRALRIAAFAIERDVDIVLLNESDRSGLQRGDQPLRAASSRVP
jgi:hypothetical protein